MSDSAPEANRSAATRAWRKPLAGVAAVAILGAALGAYFGLRANLGGAASGGTNPPPRTQSALAYDDATGQLVLFGGLGEGNKPLGDTWTWDGHAWTHEHPATAPPARFGGLMAYDPQSRSVLLIGGVQATVWSSSGAVGCAIGGVIPPGASGAATAVPSACAPSRGAAPQPTLPGSDTWLWSGGDWHRVAGSQPTLVGAQMATDPGSGHIVLVSSPGPVPELGAPAIACPVKSGAIPNENFVCGRPLPVRGPETWIWRDGGWHRSTATLSGTVGRWAPGRLVEDARSGRVAYFTGPSVLSCVVPTVVPSAPTQRCPLAGKGLLPIDGVWTESTWTGSSWTAAKAVAPAPANLLAGTAAPDPAQHDTVFLSSSDAATLTFDGTWKNTLPHSHPPYLQGAAMAYDGDTAQVVLFGGDRGDYVAVLSSETWTWDGSDWKLVSGTVSSSAPPSPSGAPGSAVPLPAQVSPPKNLHPVS